MRREQARRNLLEAEVSAKTAYVAVVSHDLKSPVHVFKLACECLQQTSLDAEQAELLETMLDATHLMQVRAARCGRRSVGERSGQRHHRDETSATSLPCPRVIVTTAHSAGPGPPRSTRCQTS